MSQHQKRKLSRTKKLAFATVTLLMFALVGEIGLRMGMSTASLNKSYRPFRFVAPEKLRDSQLPDELQESLKGRFRSHPFLPYSGRPGLTKTYVQNYPFQKNVTIRFTNNSYGFRTREFPRKKGPDDFYVLCFGGSTTWGCSDSNDNTWPGVLERKLKERYPRRRIFVFNLAIDAGCSPMSLVNYCLVGVHLQPDLVVVYHGVNELWTGLGAKDFQTDYSHSLKDVDARRLNPVWRGFQAHLPNWAFHSAVVSVMTKLVDDSLGTNDLGVSLEEKDFPRDEDPLKGIEVFFQNLRTMAAIAEGHGTRIIFSTFHWFDDGDAKTSRFNQELRKFLSDNGLAFVDQARLLPHHEPAIHIDPVHFTQLGRNMLAENFANFIVKQGYVERP